MPEAATADAHAEHIEVDLDAKPDEAVRRVKAETGVTREEARRSRDEEWMDRSKKVQRRMSNMQRTFDQRMAEQEARHQREISQLREGMNGTRRGESDAPDADQTKHDAKIAALQAQLEEAQNQGDSKESAKLMAEIARIEGQFWNAKTNAATGAAARTAAAANPNPTAAQPRKPTAAGQAWTRANTEWWDNPDDDEAVAAKAMAGALHQKACAEGSDPEKPEHYARIAKQLKRRFPELTFLAGPDDEDEEDEEDVRPAHRARALEDTEDPEDDDAQSARRANRDGKNKFRRGQSPTHLTDRGNPPARRNVATLDRGDISTMRKIGLDPDNNKHVMQFMREKQEMREQA